MQPLGETVRLSLFPVFKFTGLSKFPVWEYFPLQIDATRKWYCLKCKPIKHTIWYLFHLLYVKGILIFSFGLLPHVEGLSSTLLDSLFWLIEIYIIQIQTYKLLSTGQENQVTKFDMFPAQRSISNGRPHSANYLKKPTKGYRQCFFDIKLV